MARFVMATLSMLNLGLALLNALYPETLSIFVAHFNLFVSAYLGWVGGEI